MEMVKTCKLAYFGHIMRKWRSLETRRHAGSSTWKLSTQ